MFSHECDSCCAVGMVMPKLLRPSQTKCVKPSKVDGNTGEMSQRDHVRLMSVRRPGSCHTNETHVRKGQKLEGCEVLQTWLSGKREDSLTKVPPPEQYCSFGSSHKYSRECACERKEDT